MLAKRDWRRSSLGKQESRFEDGSVLVELAEFCEPGAVARAARVTLPGEGDQVGALGRRLANRQMLVVVDNCEHLVGAAAENAARLLLEGERIKVVATSRERLNVEGETTYRLPSLTLPETSDATRVAAGTDAVRLFVESARSARPGFDIDAGKSFSPASITPALGMPTGAACRGEVAAAVRRFLEPVAL